MEQGPSRRGKGFLAGMASLVMPGLGQALAGRWRRGVAWFAAAHLIAAIGFLLTAAHGRILLALVLVVPLGVGAALACVVDAYLIGRRSERRMLGRPWARYAAGVVVVAVGMVVAPQTRAVAATRPWWAEAYVMPTPSMSPTIVPGDRFLATKRGRTWRRWEVVVMDAPELPPGTPPTTYCKRIVGLPGETVEVRHGVVHINGVAADAPAGLGPNVIPAGMAGLRGTDGYPVTLAADEYFVLGDNGALSADSRFWRTRVTEKMLLGHVTMIYWPYSRWRIMDR